MAHEPWHFPPGHPESNLPAPEPRTVAPPGEVFRTLMLFAEVNETEAKSLAERIKWHRVANICADALRDLGEDL